MTFFVVKAHNFSDCIVIRVPLSQLLSPLHKQEIIPFIYQGMVSCIKDDYILRLKTTLSENIALPAIKLTTAIIGRLIVAPAIPVDIPIRIDRPNVSKITTAAYQPE